MKKYVMPFISILLSFCASAQTKKEFITGDIVTVNSKILKENRSHLVKPQQAMRQPKRSIAKKSFVSLCWFWQSCLP
jgi:hypothetical protein